MKLFELFELLELDRSAQLDNSNVDDLEKHLNRTLFRPKSHIEKNAPVMNIDLDRQDHFMDRAKERNMSVSDVERTIKKGYRQNWNWIKQKAYDNNVANDKDGKHFIDPVKGIDIPMNITRTPGTVRKDRVQGTAVTKDMEKKRDTAKNTIYPKTIIDRSTTKNGETQPMSGSDADPKWLNIKKGLGYE